MVNFPSDAETLLLISSRRAKGRNSSRQAASFEKDLRSASKSSLILCVRAGRRKSLPLYGGGSASTCHANASAPGGSTTETPFFAFFCRPTFALIPPDADPAPAARLRFPSHRHATAAGPPAHAGAPDPGHPALGDGPLDPADRRNPRFHRPDCDDMPPSRRPHRLSPTSRGEEAHSGPRRMTPQPGAPNPT
jgi:hypothetical protein